MLDCLEGKSSEGWGSRLAFFVTELNWAKVVRAWRRGRRASLAGSRCSVLYIGAKLGVSLDDTENQQPFSLHSLILT